MAYQMMNMSCDSSFHSNFQFHNESFLHPNMKPNPFYEVEEYTQQRQNDKDFICNFIEARNRKEIAKKKPINLKIHDARKNLDEIMILKKEIEKDNESLDINVDDFNTKWDEIVLKQNKIIALLNKFDEESVRFLKIAVEKRKKKRNWEKRMKEKRKDFVKEKEECKKLKNALIDKLLEKKSKEAESAKRKEALKRQADSVLHEVRTKKYEAKKMLKMLAAILKLRELRSQQEVAQGGYCSKEITGTLTSVINHFQELWKKQSELYNLEEKGLRVMLEESDFKEIKISDFEKILNQWEEAIFGIPRADENYRYLTQADNDINAFILVRREWDQYISGFTTVCSSPIPIGWIMPPETDNPEWKSFLKLRKRQ